MKKSKIFLKKYIDAFLHLFFPNICLYCSNPLLESEETVCYRCISSLEVNRELDFRDNEVAHLFEGKVKINLATVGFRYHKKGILQKLIFQLKYHHHKEIGIILGREMTYALGNTEFSTVDYIIPVPLHPKKERKRGYNQSFFIAKEISEVLKKEVRTDILKRKTNTVSQTKKSRMERFENMENVFFITNGSTLEGKHILLIDDVVTTGSTLVNCAEILEKEVKNIQISIACLAKAD